MNKNDVIARGTDSSGRPVRQTRQAWQFYDRVNREAAHGKLVIVQGAFNYGVSASAGTHDKAGSCDFRSWNLTGSERYTIQKFGRGLMGSMWYRHQGQGFDPHIHNSLLGDRYPIHPNAYFQHTEWIAGRNGLASRGKDDFPWRPLTFHDYIYLEDEVMNPAQEAKLDAILKAVQTGFANERERDAAQRDRDKERFRHVVSELGKQADAITVLINSVKDTATKEELRKLKDHQRKILKKLHEDPDVTEEDNPSEEGLEEAGVE